MRVSVKGCAAVGLLAPFLLLSAGCNPITSTAQPVMQQEPALGKGEWLTVSVMNASGKSGIFALDPHTGKKVNTLSDSDVMLSGQLSSDGEWVSFADARGQDDPWDLFLYNVQTKKIMQATQDPLGQSLPRFGEDSVQVLYAKSESAQSPVQKIARIDVAPKQQTLLDADNPDRAVESFDVSGDQIIAATYSQKEDDARYEKANNDGTELAPMPYHLTVFDTTGKAVRELATISTVYIDSIAWSEDRQSIVFTGENVDGHPGQGIYRLYVDDGTWEPILLSADVAGLGGPIDTLGMHPYATLSPDGKSVYFVSKPRGATEFSVAGLSMEPSAVYRYDLQSKKLSEVYYDPQSTVSDLNLTVVK